MFYLGRPQIREEGRQRRSEGIKAKAMLLTTFNFKNKETSEIMFEEMK